jgi:hypothetical protein
VHTRSSDLLSNRTLHCQLLSVIILRERAYRVVSARVGVEDKSDNETVKTQNLGENEDKNLPVSFPLFEWRSKAFSDDLKLTIPTKSLGC